MYIYCIKGDEFDYDEYDGYVCIAKGEEDAINLGKNMLISGKITIKKIGVAEEGQVVGIVLSSYNAG